MVICLSALPALPNSLLTLSCRFNQLTSLPALPNSLSILACNNNQLLLLPQMPDSLTYLLCQYNQLTEIPTLPNLHKVYNVDCSFNQLISITNIPDSINDFECQNNTNLSCLPKLEMIHFLNFTATNIACLPNYGNVISTQPFGILPLCNLFSANGCNFYWNINGEIFLDNDTNCINTNGDITLNDVKINLYKNGNLKQQVYSNDAGKYDFDTDSLGIYNVEIDTANIPFEVLCPSIFQYEDTLTVTDSLKYDNDFALICKSGYDLAVSEIYSRGFVPAQFAGVNVSAGDQSNQFGAHCASGISGVVQIVLNGPVNYYSEGINALIPIVSGDTLTYNIADFGNVNYNEAFNFIVSTDTLATIGSLVTISISVAPDNDNDPTNNFLSLIFVVRASVDPNGKSVYPVNTLNVNSDHWLTYTIDFQNTGTAPAENILITDTLDANLDLSTFTLTGYSNHPFTQVIGNVAKFNFPNINLPDSISNEPGSHGYVQYKNKSKKQFSYWNSN